MCDVAKCERCIANLSIWPGGGVARLAERFYQTQTSVSLHLRHVPTTTPGYSGWRSEEADITVTKNWENVGIWRICLSFFP